MKYRYFEIMMKTLSLYNDQAEQYDQETHTGYRERIQNSIIFDTLDTYIGDTTSLKILDAGGGTGYYSLPYAKRGHNVTILDLSEKMLEIAEKKASKLGVRDKVRLMLRDMEETEEIPGGYDVIFCHLSLCHAKYPLKTIEGFRRLLKEDGFISLVVENREYFSMAKAFMGQPHEALGLIGKEPLIVDFERLGSVRTFGLDELLNGLTDARFKIENIKGLRVICDYIHYAKGPPEDLDALSELEIYLSTSPIWNKIARFHHIIARAI